MLSENEKKEMGGEPGSEIVLSSHLLVHNDLDYK